MLAITGYSGFIGKAISDFLPFPQKRFIRNRREEDSPSIKYYVGELQKHEDLESFIQDTTTLIHLACKSTPRNSKDASTKPFVEDLLPSIDLFETFAKYNPQGHIIFASTGGNMYKATLPHVARTEADLPMPGSSYSIQKLAAEEELRLLCNVYGISATILRISNPYGVILPKTRGQGIIGVTFSKILANEPLQIFDSPYSVRDYLYIDDLIDAFKRIVEKPPKAGECRLFNVGSGVGYSLTAVLNLIEKVTGVEIKKEYLPSSQIPQNQASWSVISPALIREKLGWVPNITLEDGLRIMWKRFSETLSLPDSTEGTRGLRDLRD